MKSAILESVAARAANGWQRAGAKFDFEVLAMPGGSVMAPALWVYSIVSSALKRPAQDSNSTQSAADVAGAERAPTADAQESTPALRCDWSRCHCT
ncbi:MAG: hypothetical protein ABI356_08675 [Steroidobacteraceae bacterium]